VFAQYFGDEAAFEMLSRFLQRQVLPERFARSRVRRSVTDRRRSAAQFGREVIRRDQIER
jgi:hypothetical protein